MQPELSGHGLECDAAIFYADFELVAFPDLSPFEDRLRNPHCVAIAPLYELDLEICHIFSVYTCRYYGQMLYANATSIL